MLSRFGRQKVGIRGAPEPESTACSGAGLLAAVPLSSCALRLYQPWERVNIAGSPPKLYLDYVEEKKRRFNFFNGKKVKPFRHFAFDPNNFVREEVETKAQGKKNLQISQRLQRLKVEEEAELEREKRRQSQLNFNSPSSLASLLEEELQEGEAMARDGGAEAEMEGRLTSAILNIERLALRSQLSAAAFDSDERKEKLIHKIEESLQVIVSYGENPLATLRLAVAGIYLEHTPISENLRDRCEAATQLLLHQWSDRLASAKLSNPEGTSGEDTGATLDRDMCLGLIVCLRRRESSASTEKILRFLRQQTQRRGFRPSVLVSDLAMLLSVFRSLMASQRNNAAPLSGANIELLERLVPLVLTALEVRLAKLHDRQVEVTNRLVRYREAKVPELNQLPRGKKSSPKEAPCADHHNAIEESLTNVECTGLFRAVVNLLRPPLAGMVPPERLKRLSSKLLSLLEYLPSRRLHLPLVLQFCQFGRQVAGVPDRAIPHLLSRCAHQLRALTFEQTMRTLELMALIHHDPAALPAPHIFIVGDVCLRLESDFGNSVLQQSPAEAARITDLLLVAEPLGNARSALWRRLVRVLVENNTTGGGEELSSVTLAKLFVLRSRVLANRDTMVDLGNQTIDDSQPIYTSTLTDSESEILSGLLRGVFGEGTFDENSAFPLAEKLVQIAFSGLPEQLVQAFPAPDLQRRRRLHVEPTKRLLLDWLSFQHQSSDPFVAPMTPERLQSESEEQEESQQRAAN